MSTKTVRKRSVALAKIIRFLMYNVVGALLPLTLSLLARRLGTIQAPPGVYAPEILFFSVMISATALGDLSDEIRVAGQSPLFQLLSGTLLFGAVGSACLYGMYQYDQILGPSNVAFRGNITFYALAVAVFLFTASLTTETLLAFIEGVTP